MKLTRTRWEGNEIIYTSDLNDNADSLTTNIDFAFDVIGSTTIITGFEVSEAAVPDMTVQVSAGIAKDDLTSNLLLSDSSVLTIPAADATQPRRDIIEIRRLTEDVSPDTRQFKDPITGSISNQVIDTQVEYKVEFKVLPGTPGAIAPAVETGWIKLCEILVPAASTTVVDANIYNVDATKSGNTNTDWTNDVDVIYRNGTVSDMKTFLVDLDNTAVKPSGAGFLANAIATFVDTTGKLIKTSLKYFETSLTNDSTKVPVSSAVYPLIIPTEVSISSTSTFTPLAGNNYRLIIDTTLGAVTVTLDDGVFDGQRINVHCIDAGTANGFYKGTGIYDGASSLGTPLSPGFDIWLEWSETEGRWTYEDVDTADYANGGQNLILKSKGSYTNIERLNLAFSAANALTGTFAFSTPFVSAPDISYIVRSIAGITTGVFGGTNIYTSSLLNTGMTITMAQAAGSFGGGESASLSIFSDGDY